MRHYCFLSQPRLSFIMIRMQVSAAPGTKLETMTKKRQLRNPKTPQRFQTSVGNFC